MTDGRALAHNKICSRWPLSESTNIVGIMYAGSIWPFGSGARVLVVNQVRDESDASFGFGGFRWGGRLQMTRVWFVGWDADLRVFWCSVYYVLGKLMIILSS